MRNKLLLMTASVIHRFYLCNFWTFDISWCLKWNPHTTTDDLEACERTGAGTPRVRWAAFSMTLDFKEKCLLDLSSVLFAFWALRLYCTYLYFVCWSFLVGPTILFRRGGEEWGSDALYFGTADGKQGPWQLRRLGESKVKDGLHQVCGPGSCAFLEKWVLFWNCSGHVMETLTSISQL